MVPRVPRQFQDEVAADAAQLAERAFALVEGGLKDYARTA